jgi:hypothetical protein
MPGDYQFSVFIAPVCCIAMGQDGRRQLGGQVQTNKRAGTHRFVATAQPSAADQCWSLPAKER